MDTIFFYLYILSLILSLVSFIVIKCVFKINYLDKFVYEDTEDTSINAQIMFYLSHFIFYVPFGLIFSFDIFPEMILKIVFFEFSLAAIKNCDPYNIDNMDFAILCSVVDIISYIIGALIHISMIKK